MTIKLNQNRKSISVFLLSIAAYLTLALGLSSFPAKASETVVYDGTSYTVGRMLFDNSTYQDFYSVVSVQPWFQGNLGCYSQGTCDSTAANFAVLPSTLLDDSNGVAITVAVNPADFEEFDNVEFLRIVGFGIEGSFYNSLNIFGGVLCAIGTILECESGGGGGGPSTADTFASMQPNASAMKNAFNSQYATLANGLNHDCTVFDTNGVCVSVFGRNTSLNDSSFDNNAAGLILGYKPHAQFRIGAYIDQSLNSNTTGGLKVERSNPDVGVFGVWNMNADGSGLELRAAANYGKRDLNVSRSVVGTSEAGSGSSDLNAYGALLEASFSHALNDTWMAKPYAGVRYLSIKRDSYTERMTDEVANPLRYSGLEQETTSAVVGVRLNGRLAPKLVASLNAGFEHDLHHSIDDYRATGVDDLGSIDMNSQKDRTRPTAGLGIAYDVADKQRVSASVQYRKEVFMSESSTTGQVNYTIGF
jgi:hypothetical protein